MFNFLGQGGWLLMPLSGALAVAVAWRSRTVRPLLLLAGAFVLLYLTVGPLKVLTDRAAPSSDLPPTHSVRIFNDLPPTEYDLSYPSGHVANAIVWYGVMAVLLTALTEGRLHPRVHRLIRFAPRRSCWSRRPI